MIGNARIFIHIDMCRDIRTFIQMINDDDQYIYINIIY